MTLQVTNTLTGEREEFEPVDDDEVTLYLCGLTTSDPAHVGHARTWTHTDVVHRWLEYLGYDVRHVENFTDVNEKIVARVGEVGDDEESVARHYTESFVDDMRALNLKRADVYPRVSEHIDEIIAMVETLVEAGYAYESDGSVYFDVTADDDYGKLSNQDVEASEVQGDEAELAEKRHPADFALWKAGGVDPTDIAQHRHDEAAPAEEAAERAQTWESPWGEGRPGWHIECSAMSTTHLGDTFDIHVAGSDLVFPHNENEIAQSECATGERFSKYWLHTGMVQVEDEKMSSSLRNFTTARGAIEEFGVDVLRTFFVSTVYSADPTFSEETLAEAEERWEQLERGYERAVEAADSVDAYATAADPALREAVESARVDFEAAMNDDLNTREAMAALLELASAVNAHVDERDRYDFPGLKRAIDAFEALGGDVFGLSLGTAEGGEVRVAEDLAELVLDLREREREAGNYERADELRDRLDEVGVAVEDGDDGPTYRFE
ncbi:cysteinyl-tRNA synthetase [Halosimplex carlsbadense 2-9-1]|uniref:Cysteine--tRNA ligase n=1 Tax=Halosimplex carlsbadense 2-9-1 TaxID=797114 RepID=M0CBJ6_9EURY|nr:cysteine--tRNA ligase [Halosimplex carlsbadense]ELZ20600.1 cysteinyl-tRNA synthetase [Halosimplex carlsbadense 2-9-1]